MFYYDYYSLVLLLPMMIFSLIIQGVLNSTYSKYKKIQNSRNITGAQISQMILQSAGVFDVTITTVSGNLTDHFDPKRKVIRLSPEVYNGTSIASIGVAAHETGHALQYASGYFPLKIRSAIVGVTNFSSRLLYFVILLSFLSGFSLLTDIAVVCFLIIFAFQLITLPVEFNASLRAIENIRNIGFDDSNIQGVKKVLSSAAMTYVAAMLTSLARLVTFYLRNSRRR